MLIYSPVRLERPSPNISRVSGVAHSSNNARTSGMGRCSPVFPMVRVRRVFIKTP